MTVSSNSAAPIRDLGCQYSHPEIASHRCDPVLRNCPFTRWKKPILDALRKCRRLIIEAPTGSGKSTQVPQMLQESGLLGGGEILVLQPRRLAARMLAKRVAREMGTSLGGGVGFQVRFESRISKDTRIKFLTEGILLRRLVDDPTLKGVAAILFDEFHERHLYGDVSLGRALVLQRTVRPDLHLLVMSATLDTVGLESFLDPCVTIRSEGRTFFRRATVSPQDALPRRDLPDRREGSGRSDPVLSRDGNALVFMPGAYEIRRTIDLIGPRLAGSGIEVHPLHGELPADQQDRAVEQGGPRRVIVSTNIAETSITIEGVRVVIDSGLARVASFDARRGINTLLIEKISRASAAQRAGRAGRTGPGVCLSMWTERDHAARPAFEPPEVNRLDLAEIVLALRVGGIRDLDSFPWVEPPNPEHLVQADRLLRDLGAIDPREWGLPSSERIYWSFPVQSTARPSSDRGERAIVACRRPPGSPPLSQSPRPFSFGHGGRDSQKIPRGRFLSIGKKRTTCWLTCGHLAFAEKKLRFDPRACGDAGIHAVTGAAGHSAGWPPSAGGRFPEGFRLMAVRRAMRTWRGAYWRDSATTLACRQDRGTLRCALVGGAAGNPGPGKPGPGQSPSSVAIEISEIEGRSSNGHHAAQLVLWGGGRLAAGKLFP